jgi:hypothetical protein
VTEQHGPAPLVSAPARTPDSITAIKEQHMPDTTAAVTMRIVLWPTAGDVAFQRTVQERPLDDANPEERRFFAEEYADIPLLELWRRLRLAEWNAAEWQRQAEQSQQISRRTPPLHVIEAMDARHKRIKALLAKPGPISKALLTAALAEPDDAWHARTSTTDQGAAA